MTFSAPVYALTGQVAARVGGVVWMPFVVAFLVAIITAFSYLELVTKYPASRAFAANLGEAFDLDLGDGVKITLVAARVHHPDRDCELPRRRGRVSRPMSCSLASSCPDSY